MSELKTGRLSNEELEYIRDNYKTQSVREIATALKRRIEAIRPAVDTVRKEEKQSELEPHQKSLQDEVFWISIQDQFSEKELDAFEMYWAEYINQFNDDINFSEKTQVVDLIKLRLLIDRNLIERNSARMETDKLQQALQEFNLKHGKVRPDQMELYNEQRELKEQIIMAQGSYNARTNEFKTLLEKHQTYLDELKATRKQRQDLMNKSKKDWVSLMKSIKDEELRAKEGRELGLMQMASDKEFKRLSEYHKYIDGTLDKPILNANTVEEEQE
jgi:hypothetical protein